MNKALFFILVFTLSAIVSASPDLAVWKIQAAATAGNVVVDDAGYTFDGTEGMDYDYGDLTGGAGATVEFIFNVMDTGAVSTALAAVPGGDSHPNGYKLDQWNRTGVFGMTVPGVGDYRFDGAASAFDADVHVVFVNRTDGQYEIFVNGVSMGTDTRGDSWVTDGGIGRLGCMQRIGTNDNIDVCTGTFYGVATYNRALTAAEIADLYLATEADSFPANLAIWQAQAQATSDNVVADKTGWTFDGTAGIDYDYGDLTGGDGGTVEFIFNLTDTAAVSTAIAAVPGSSTHPNGYKLEQYNGTGIFGMTVPGVGDYRFNSAPSVYDADVHVVFVNRTDGQYEIFINGVSMGTDTRGGDWMTNGGLGRLGCMQLVGSNDNIDVCSGTIYAVATYDRALTATEITELFLATTLATKTKATLVEPAPNGNSGISVDTPLVWAAPNSYTPVGYRVYFGSTEPNDQQADYGLTELTAGIENITTIDPSPLGGLDALTTYYWVVDTYESNSPDAPILHQGDYWHFTTEWQPLPPCAYYRFDGDVNGDCFVDITDLMLLAHDWMQAAVVADTDINEDSKVNMADYSYVGRDWQSYVNNEPSILILSCHPDDEGIFFGGVMSYYPQVENVRTYHISMTSGDYNRPPEIREDELTNADTIYYGRPVTTSIGSPLDTVIDTSADLFFPRFKDEPTNIVNTYDYWYDGILDYDDSELGKQKAIDTLASYIRILKPTVIVGHDIDGEYGHGNHKATGTALAACYDRAADPGYVDGNDLWLAMKLYIHQSEGNGLGTPGYTFINWLFHDYLEETSIDTDGDGSPDMTPRQVTNVGLKEHYSQGAYDASTVYETGESFDSHHSEWWGLYRSTVGPDTIAAPFTIMGKDYNDGTNDGWAIGNFFENIPGF